MSIDALLPAIREFVETELYPLEPRFLHEPFRQLLPALREKREMVRARGWFTPHRLPGITLAQYGRISEELGRTPFGHYVFHSQSPDVGNMEILERYATPAQRAEFLDPLLAGETRSCFAMTEPEFAGSNPTWMQSSAVLDRGEWVINGHKWFTSSADGAAFVLLMAVTDPEAPKPHQRASMILVSTATPGFRIVRNISIMGEPNEDWPSHSEVLFENCRVPAANLMGERGRGFAIAQERLGPGRIHHCMRWIGVCERAFDLMCRQAARRELAPGRLLATRQLVQGWIAESRTAIHAARLMVLDAARKIDEQGASAAREEVSMIKWFVAGVMQQVLDHAIQAHGALGMTDDLVLSYWWRHERAARIYDGPDEVHKAVIARTALRRYGVEVSIS